MGFPLRNRIMSHLTQDQRDAYHRDGFLSPLPAFTRAEAQAFRAELEAVEANNPEREKAARAGLPVTHAWAWDLVHDRRIVDPVTDVLGEDVLLWSMDWFIKEPGPSYVSYHQDATYWGLYPYHVLTAWVALSDAGPKTGPMKFIPGSHRGPLYEQDDTFERDNLLSRGQRVKTEVDDEISVLAPLGVGEMSIHDVCIIHGSEPNLTSDRRIGMVLRYCATDVKQTKVDGDRAILVNGVDRYGHFEAIPRPGTDNGDAERDRALLHGTTRMKALMDFDPAEAEAKRQRS